MTSPPHKRPRILVEAGKDRWARPGGQAWLRRRELGARRAGEPGSTARDALYLYRSLATKGAGPATLHLGSREEKALSESGAPWTTWESRSGAVGGIFGLDFSPDGALLGAATERSSLVLLDPLRAQPVLTIPKAHEDCVNTLRFLDSRTLASCSDDKSVKVWDIRAGTRPLRVLRTHAGWVKNVEYVRESGLLLSSAFDGFVYGWELNDPSAEPQRLFHADGLMRMRLTPDSSKMLLSTQWGYILAIHNLHVPSMPQDLFGFNPSVHWLRLKSNVSSAAAEDSASRFSAKTNRTELLMDFPDRCDPENISSLAPHPSSALVASRSNHHDEQSEWTCLHDLRIPRAHSPDDPGDPVLLRPCPEYQELRRQGENIITLSMNGVEAAAQPRPSTMQLNVRSPHGSFSLNNLELASGEPRAFYIRTGGANSAGRTLIILGQTPTPPPPGGEAAASQDSAPQDSVSQPAQGSSESEETPTGGGEEERDCPGGEGSRAGPSGAGGGEEDPPVYSRLLHFKEEPRVGRGFIKEQSWSGDGRVLASPYGFAVRLLAFAPDAPLLPDFARGQPSEFAPVATLLKRHESVVLVSKFSPSHLLLASGDHHGRIVFSQPRL